MVAIASTRFKSSNQRSTGDKKDTTADPLSSTKSRSPYLSAISTARLTSKSPCRPSKELSSPESKSKDVEASSKSNTVSAIPNKLAKKTPECQTSSSSVVTPSIKFTAYKYCVLPGNESSLIRNSLSRRPWWVEAKPNEKWNFWWGGNGQKFNFEELSISISPSSNGNNKVKDNKENNSVLSSSSCLSSKACTQRLANRLPEHKQLCTKSGLASNLAEILKRSFKLDRMESNNNGASSNASASRSISWIPETYVLESGKCGKGNSGSGKGSYGDVNVDRFLTSFKSHSLRSDGNSETKSRAGRAWIVKPTNMNRGNGIEIFEDAKELLNFIESKKSGSKWVVQKYIDDPLLVQGRKFDIRAYALVVPAAALPEEGGGQGAGGAGGVYFHREAYIRTSGVVFKPDDLTDKASHLTNDAVQKLRPETYNAHEDHCKLSLPELQEHLLRDGSTSDPNFISNTVWPAMRDCVACLFDFTLSSLNPSRKKHCFELLGLDFMLDKKGGIYLIEVNTSPALFTAGACLEDLIPRVVEEVAQKVLDPIFPGPKGEEAEGCKVGEKEEGKLDGFVRVI